MGRLGKRSRRLEKFYRAGEDGLTPLEEEVHRRALEKCTTIELTVLCDLYKFLKEHVGESFTEFYPEMTELQREMYYQFNHYRWEVEQEMDEEESTRAEPRAP
jgi:hypothetical protein